MLFIANTHNHGHGNGHDLSNALKASVLPVGTTTPGSNVAHSLATPAKNSDVGEPKVNKVIVVFKEGTEKSEIENAINDIQSQGKSPFQASRKPIERRKYKLLHSMLGGGGIEVTRVPRLVLSFLSLGRVI